VKRFGVKVTYDGQPTAELDRWIKTAASPGQWWAQGYDFGTEERDLAFDYKSKAERLSGMRRMLGIPGVSVELRDEP